MQLRKIAVSLVQRKKRTQDMQANFLAADANSNNSTTIDVTNQKTPSGRDQGVMEEGKKVKSAKERMQTQPSPVISTVWDLFLLNACN